MTQSIMDIILRFRSHRIAVAGDIEKAFLMVSVAKVDRNVLRFLWLDDVWSEHPKVITLRFTRIVFGLSSSPFLLNATIRHHIEQYRCEEPKFVDALLQAIYVDVLNSGGNDDDSVYMFYKKAKPGLAKGGLNLRKFVTNSPGLMEKIERNESTLFSKPAKDISTSHNSEQPDAVDEDETYSKIALGIEPTTSESEQRRQRVLGVNWNFVEDQLVFDLSGIAELAKPAKYRSTLR